MNPYAEYFKKLTEDVGNKKHEYHLLAQMQQAGLKHPEREYKFHPSRKWRFDFAFIDEKIAIEVEGGIWSGGRHTRGSGFEDDCEKYNEATAAGWHVYRFTPKMITDLSAIRLIEKVVPHGESK